jgi:RND family efflux transporter MFP subunit
LPLGVLLGVAGTRLIAPQPQPPAPTSAPESGTDKPDGVVNFSRDKWDTAGIRTEPVAAAPLADFAWRTGRIEIDEDRVTHVSPPVEGLIVDVRVRLGDEVAAGAVMAVLQSREVGQAKLDLTTARLTAAAERERAGWAADTAANTAELVKEVTAGKPVAQIDAMFKDRQVGERRQTLMAAYAQRNQLRAQVESQRVGAAAVAGAVREKTEADLAAAEAALRALCEEFKFQATQQARQAELKQKEATVALDVARTRLLMLGYTAAQVEEMDAVKEGAAASRFEIRAPFAGTVVEKHAVRSERVGPQFQMFRIADLSSVWVRADAFEADLPLLRRLGRRGLVFRAPAAEIEKQSADLVYAGDIVDPNSRALTVTAEAKNPERALKPGMYLEVGLPRGGSEPVIQVPASAVQRHEGKVFVFVHVEGDKFRRVDVELGREAGDRVEVKSGLSTGDAVVVAGGFVLKSELYRDQLAGD